MKPLLLALLLVGCTEQEAAKNFGGSMHMDLPQGRKLVVVTWKEDNLWYLTRPMRKDERAEAYKFEESSSWGVWQGTINIVEHNSPGMEERP